MAQKEVVREMRKLPLAVLLATIAFAPALTGHAQTCDSNHYNMLDWMTLDTATTQHLTGVSNPLYNVLPDGSKFWWIKGSSGYPWDVQHYDSTYIYQWVTENVWGDPTTFKAFASNTALAWTYICVPKGPVGSKLASISVPNVDTAYNAYTSGCVKQGTQYLGNTVNEIWNYGNLDLGGNIGNQPDLQLSYRYSCDANYNNCTYKEVYDFQQGYGLVRWTYYKLQNGTYVQQNQTVHANTASGGAPTPDFPCGLP
jgi:hypothetical protein